jgi:drug/metabolite transporter (DMT)-like permease
MKNSSSKILTIAMIISMILWGISWPSNKVMKEFGNPLELAFFRNLFVVISLFLILIIAKVPIKIKKEAIPFVLITGVLMALYNYTFLMGLDKGTPGAGGILVTTLNPIMAYGIGILVAKRKPLVNESIGLFLGLVGACFLLQIWDGASDLLKKWNLFFLSCALVWAVMSKFTSKSGNYGSPFAFSWWMYLVTIITLLPLVDYAEVNNIIHVKEMRFWGNLLFSSVITTSLATTMYFYATSKIGAEKASSFIFTVPFTAAISSYFVFGELIHWYTIVGGIFGISAVWILNRKTKKTSEN